MQLNRMIPSFIRGLRRRRGLIVVQCLLSLCAFGSLAAQSEARSLMAPLENAPLNWSALEKEA